MVNYTEREVPFTRIIEHKHFEYGTQDKTVITREYLADWKPGDEPYYPDQRRQQRPVQAVRGAGGAGGRRGISPVAQADTSTTTWTRPSHRLRARPQRAGRGADGGVKDKRPQVTTK